MTANPIDNMTKAQLTEYIQIQEELARLQALKTSTCVGFVDPIKGFTHSIIKDNNGGWGITQKEPEMYLAAKLERVLTSKKRFIVVIGGRGSSKSVGIGDIALIDARDNLSKSYFLREFQSSIKSSVHSLLKEEISRLEFEDFEVNDNTIKFKGEPVFEFAGMARSDDSIKSAHGFKSFKVEESQFISKKSLDTLTPTARNMPNKGLPKQFDIEGLEEEVTKVDVNITFVANPASSEDPFSKRFIVPYLNELERDGFYEDDLHLIVVMNYTDNPWFGESGLEEERVWDKEHKSMAEYEHTWLGKFNDSVENALIQSEWFDACIDAHIKLGFEPRGAKVASHDASDKGPDAKGYAMRHGVVFQDVQEKTDGDVNQGGHWGAALAITQGVDHFSWDGDGMGAGLNEQMGRDFHGKTTQLAVYRGSEGVDNPEALYQPAFASPVANQKTNKETFKNKRAQKHWDVRDRVYRTYRAVIHGEYHDPLTLISFSSEMALLSKLRAEACRMPIKPNNSGLNELYTKEEMKAKFKIKSPNIFDSVVMANSFEPHIVTPVHIPRPIKTIGRR